MTKITFDTDDCPPRILVDLDKYGQVDGAFDCGEDLIEAVGPEEAKNYQEFYLIKVEKETQ